jgi:hypothetical protein
MEKKPTAISPYEKRLKDIKKYRLRKEKNAAKYQEQKHTKDVDDKRRTRENKKS